MKQMRCRRRITQKMCTEELEKIAGEMLIAFDMCIHFDDRRARRFPRPLHALVVSLGKRYKS